jgi:hypothetical protein
LCDGCNGMIRQRFLLNFGAEKEADTHRAGRFARPE